MIMKLNKTHCHLKDLYDKETEYICEICNQVSLTVELRTDPYAHELHYDNTLYFMCDDCAYNSSQDI